MQGLGDLLFAAFGKARVAFRRARHFFLRFLDRLHRLVHFLQVGGLLGKLLGRLVRVEKIVRILQTLLDGLEIR